ncbi:hypothetical protein CHUAL_009712 [Chamberlinius hualienensis]
MKQQGIKSFLDYINVWEVETVGCPHLFLTKVTALGFRAIIKSTLDILQYCTESLKMDYLLPARLTQEILEHYFGMIQQSKRPNVHPTPKNFLFIAHLMAIYNLVRSPNYGNCTPSTIIVLTKLADINKTTKQ